MVRQERQKSEDRVLEERKMRAFVSVSSLSPRIQCLEKKEGKEEEDCMTHTHTRWNKKKKGKIEKNMFSSVDSSLLRE